MPNWKKVITSGSDASLNSLTVVNGITGSLFGTSSWAVSSSRAITASYALTSSYVLNAISASFASTASYVNTLNQNVLITGSLTVGSSSLGASENTLTLGARDSANEGGQIGFNAPGGTWTSASFIDNWSNQIRILRGTNATSDALVTQWNLHTKQMQLPAYTAASSFPGTATANLAVDSGGNVITVSTTGGTVFPYTGNAVITGSLTATTSVIAQANGAMYFRGGDDAELWDINVVNTVGVYGQQDQGVASIKLGSGGGTISGRSGSIGIGTINPTSASLTINGNVWATSFTGSLLGTASYALQALSSSFATTASYALTAGNGGVTKIIAGANVNLSPVSGLGDVTVTAFGTNLYNTATGSYGSFYDTGSVTATSATTIYSMSLSTTDISNGVFVSASGADITRVKFTNAGVYNIQFSSQFSNSDNATQDTVVWLRKNGTDIPDSSGTVGVPPFKAGSNGQVIASWNYYVSLAANDFIQLCWHSEQANVITLETIAAGTSPTHPRTPSTILTATRVDTFLSNTGSFSGSFTGILTGTASYASQALSSSFATTASYVLQAVSASFAATASTTTAINGTQYYIPIFTTSNTLANSVLIQSASNIGIGTSTARTKLNLSSGDISAYNTSGSGVNLIGAQIYLGDSNFESAGYYNSAPGIGAVWSTVTGVPGDLALYTYNGFSNNRLENMRLFKGGNVGIGTSTVSTYRLDVSGSGRFTSDVYVTGSLNVSSSSATNQIIGNTYFTTPATAGGNVNIVSLNNTPTLTFSQAGTATRLQIYVNGGSQEITSFKSFVSTGEFNWLNNQTNYLGRLTTNGNLLLPGSGSTTQPTDAGYRLDVSGSARVIGNTLISGSIFVTSSAVTIGQFVGNQNGYAEFSLRNANAGISASTDFAIYSDTGTTTSNYIDMGINGSGYTGASYDGIYVGKANDGYLYNDGGNLYIGAANNNTSSGSLFLFAHPSGALSTVGITITGSNVGINRTGSITANLLVYGSGSANPIFSVQGSQGELFSVTDSLSGSLFSVNDISGLPVIEAFSDNTVLLGSYQAPALLTTNKIVLTASGNFTLSSLPTASYDGAFYDYTARSGSNARAGSIMAIWSGSSVNFTETTTTDFGTTTGLNLAVFVSGANMILTGSASTTAWTIKTIIRSI
jgi:hypothetical protein